MSNATDTSKINERVGARLRELRQKAGHSMGIAFRVAEVYGVKLDPSILSNMERGKRDIPVRVIYALAHFLKVSVTDVVCCDSSGPEASAPEATGYYPWKPDAEVDAEVDAEIDAHTPGQKQAGTAP